MGATSGLRGLESDGPWRGEQGDQGSEPLLLTPALLLQAPPDPEAQLGVRALLTRPAQGNNPGPQALPDPASSTRLLPCRHQAATTLAAPPPPPLLCFQAGCLSSDEEALQGCRQHVGRPGVGLGPRWGWRAGGQRSSPLGSGDPRLKCVYLWPSPASCLREGAQRGL